MKLLVRSMESSPLRMDCKICMDMEVGLFLLLGRIGIDCRMVLVPCLWHIMWFKLGGYYFRWTMVVPG